MIILWFGGDHLLRGADFGALCALTRSSHVVSTGST
jgi:hypothetical protein